MSACKSRTSSPDPLGLSQDCIPASSPCKASGKRITPRKALRNSNGNIRLQDFYINTPPVPRAFSSPSKSVTRSENVASPWRIRVTVEAEPEKATAVSPKAAMIGKTTTTTVPLKNGEASTPIREKRGRGRPRKSLDGPVKRSVTPKPKATSNNRSSRFTKARELDDDVPGGTTTPPPKRPRGRPRKSLEPGSQKTGTEILREGILEKKDDKDNQEAVKGREEIEIRPRSGTTMTLLSPMVLLETTNHTMSHSSEPAANAKANEDSKRHEHENSTREVPYSEASFNQSEFERAEEAKWRSKLRHDSLSPTKLQQRFSAAYASGKSAKKADTDPTEEHQEFDSILESEGFSMVSISSLPSVQQHSAEIEVSKKQDLARPAEDLYRHSAVCAQPLDEPAVRDLTPPPASALVLPPPVPSVEARTSPRPLVKPTDGTPKLARIVRAGIALQGVLSPTTSGSKARTSVSKSKSETATQPAKASEQRVDHLFDGFGPGTRRELRAGLRFGEELAKRQRAPQLNATLHTQQDDDVFKEDSATSGAKMPDYSSSRGYTLRVPGPERKIEYPDLTNNQLPSPEWSAIDDNDQMSWKATSPKSPAPPLPSNQNNAERDWEAEWQREREAVSKQIQDANSSQVIVINSDSEDELQEEEEEEYEEDTDICSAAANSGSETEEAANETDLAILEPELPKPKRSKIPSPWRRQSEVVYTDELEPTSSGMMQPKKQAAKAIAKGRHAVGQMNDEPASSPGLPCTTETPLTEPILRGDTSNQGTSKPLMVPEHTSQLLVPLIDDGVFEESITRESLHVFSSQKLSEVKGIDQVASDISYPDEIQDPGSYHNTLSNAFIVDHGDSTMTDEAESSFQDDNTTSYLCSPSHTPPGFPPKRLYKNLYKPSPPPASMQTSWLSGLASFMPRIWTSASDFPPLYTHLPVNNAHHYIFLPYYLAQHADPTTYPFNPYSPNAKLLNVSMISIGNEGWIKYFSKPDIGLIDKMQEVLRVKGVRRRGFWATGDGEPIDEIELAKIVHTLWRDGVQKGHWEPGEGNGTGNVAFSKKKWTKADIKREPYPAIGFIMP